MVSEECPQKKHIQQIRDEFRIGPDKTRVFDSLNDSISHLAESLYQKDTHFILELIQNAEDNTYPENVDPELILHFLDEDPTDTPDVDGGLLVVNNEIGFQPEHVSALCAIGQTTKKDKRKGYIGEKGIGFKSVFTVSNQPYIFSGGYQFKFQDIVDPELGFRFIVPTWVENYFDDVRPYTDKTCILLPLRKEKRKLVEEQLQQIAPETILFLKKIRGMQIKIKGKEASKFLKHDLGKNLIDISSTEGQCKYWYYDKEFDVPPEIYEEKRMDIDSRIVSIAFPLTDSFPVKETVYAFLPTNVQSGLNFLINADFILATNRERIRENLPWNLWIRDSIASTFLEAFENLIKSKKYRFYAYRVIPLISIHRDSFFQAVVEEIISGIKMKKVVLTIDGKSLVEPERARFVGKEFRGFINPTNPPNQLKLTPLVHPELEKGEYKEPLKEIGVKTLTSEEIINCLSDDVWINGQQTDWFVCLYHFLSKQEWATRDRLINLKLVPTENGEKLCGITNWVYFPDDRARKVFKEYPDVFRYLRISYIDRKLYKILKSQTELMAWVSNILEVAEFNLNNLCKNLAGKLKADHNSLEDIDLIRFTKFIREHFQELDEPEQMMVKDLLPLLLEDGTRITPSYWYDDQPLALPPSADPVAGWQVLFSNPEDREHMAILSDRYLQGDSNDKKKLWLDFFIDIGATKNPYPRKEKIEFHRYSIPDEIAPHIREWINNHLYNTKYNNILENHKAPSWLLKIADNPRIKPNNKQYRALLRWLENQDLNNPDWTQAVYKWYYRGWEKETIDSEFWYSIQNTPWYPTTKGYKRPSEVFIDKPEIREFFGDTLSYSKARIGDHVAKFLNLRTSATVEQFMELLRDLSHQPADKADLKLISKIYTFLSDRWNDNIREEFENNPWIYTAKPDPKWLNLNESIWLELPLGFDGVAYTDISAQYSARLSSFFVKQLGIRDSLDDESYAQAFLNLSRLPSPMPDKVESALEKIFPVLLKVSKEQTKPIWWEGFLLEVFIWTQSDQFCPPSEVFIPDDGELQKKMESVGTQFAWRPLKDSFADYRSLYHELGVRSLVDSVEIDVELPKGYAEQEDQTEILLTNDAKKAVCYYLRNSAGNDPRKLYERLKSDGKIEALLSTYEERVSELNTVFRLDGMVAWNDNTATFWDRDKRKLYVSSCFSQDVLEIEIPSVIARRLVNVQLSKDLENFLGRLLGCSYEKVERIIQKNNWTIPEEEIAWIDNILGNPPLTFRKEDAGETEIEQTVGGQPRNDLPGMDSNGGSQSEGGQQKSRQSGESHPGRGKARISNRTYLDRDYSGGGTVSQRPRMVTYIEKSDNGDDEGHPSSSDKGKKIAEAGIFKVLKYEEAHGRKKAQYLGPTHEGWDIDSEENVIDGIDAILNKTVIRRIEVKSKEHEWDGWGIGFTPNEFKEALKYGDNYYLYVVENALDSDDNRPPYIFRNPMAMITDYRLDENWRNWSIKEE